LLAALLEVTLGAKRLFGQTRSQDATMLQIQALGILFAQPGLTPTFLGRRLFLSSSATAQLLQRLMEAGWIQRKPSVADLRVVVLGLTEEGMAVLARYGQAQNKEQIVAAFSGLSDTEKHQLTALLEKLNVSLRKDIINEKEQ
jgi:DNA-binding MarR family transcriptional regulator